MPRRKINRGKAGRGALLHALAHIELNAVDLAADIIARFAGPDLPRAFYDDWLKVADEEGKVAAKNILSGDPRPVDDSVVPSAA